MFSHAPNTFLKLVNLISHSITYLTVLRHSSFRYLTAIMHLKNDVSSALHIKVRFALKKLLRKCPPDYDCLCSPEDIEPSQRPNLVISGSLIKITDILKNLSN